YNGPKCRLCRREGEKLYLKGARCESEKCAMNRRPQAPGQHGNSRSKLTSFGQQLREKQKAKKIYGVLEKTFRIYVDKAMRSNDVTGQVLMQTLESRFDNMVYRSGFAVSRAQARQFIRSGLFTINGKVNTIPSTQLRVGDTLKPLDFNKIHLREGFSLPEWLLANVKDRYVQYERAPLLDELSDNVNVQLIVEYYSR
ncbi:30S ribosomal protein S4, partial [candidate division WWE3 bacterium]|nr:30S ribosomal protein S4 [candidate division WWE3 bacterium]